MNSCKCQLYVHAARLDLTSVLLATLDLTQVWVFGLSREWGWGKLGLTGVLVFVVVLGQLLLPDVKSGGGHGCGGLPR